MKRSVISLILSLCMLLSVIMSVAATEQKANLSFYTPSTQYKNSIYYQNAVNVTLTGNYADDLVAIARSQKGYTENNGYTEYGYAFGNSYGDWCAYFISWCARAANIPQDLIKSTGGASPSQACFDMPYKANDGTYSPRKGDLVFFGFPSQSGYTHVGIVTDVSSFASTGNFSYIDGNGGSPAVDVSEQTKNKNWSYNGEAIKGFGVWSEQSLNIEDVFTTYPEYLFFDKIGWSPIDIYIFNTYSTVLEQADDAGADFVYTLKNLTSIFIRDVLHLSNRTTREELLLDAAKLFMAEYNQISLKCSEGMKVSSMISN